MFIILEPGSFKMHMFPRAPLPSSALQHWGISKRWTGLEPDRCHLQFQGQVDSSKNIQFTWNYNQLSYCQSSSSRSSFLFGRSKFQERSASSTSCMQIASECDYLALCICAAMVTTKLAYSSRGWLINLCQHEAWSHSWLMAIIMLLQTGNSNYEACIYGLPPTKEGLAFRVSAGISDSSNDTYTIHSCWSELMHMQCMHATHCMYTMRLSYYGIYFCSGTISEPYSLWSARCKTGPLWCFGWVDVLSAYIHWMVIQQVAHKCFEWVIIQWNSHAVSHWQWFVIGYSISPMKLIGFFIFNNLYRSLISDLRTYIEDVLLIPSHAHHTAY